MNNRDIPSDKINEVAARVRGFVHYSGPWWRDSHGAMLHIVVDNPLTNHNQFHEIWTPDMEAKACDVLDEWLTTEVVRYDRLEVMYMWWANPKYKANRRLWQLRAIVEVLENGNNT